MCEGYLLIDIYTGDTVLQPEGVNIKEYSLREYDALITDARKRVYQALRSQGIEPKGGSIDNYIDTIKRQSHVTIGDVYIEYREIHQDMLAPVR